MESYKSNAELKRLARMQLGGKWGLLIGANILTSLITSLALYAVAAVIPATSSAMYLLNYVVTFIVQLLSFVLQTGLCLLYLHASCGMECRLSDIFYAFRNSPDKSLKVGLVSVSISTLCMIPADIMSQDMFSVLDGLELSTTENLLEFYSMLSSFYVATLICMLVYFVLTIPFFAAQYMILDFPEASAKAILLKSISVMRGNKMRFFILTISFIPLILLSLVTCGIAILWIIPYMSMTYANFYLDLISVQKVSMSKSTTP